MGENQFILYTTEDGKAAIKLYADNNTVWLNQAQMAELSATTKQNISLHIKNIFEENEVDLQTSVKDYLTDVGDGRDFQVEYYNLQVILAVGFRVRSARGTQFRKWA